MNELIDAVGHAAGLSAAQSSVAVAAMLRFFAARLPSPLFGEFQERLAAPPVSTGADAPPVKSATPWA